MSLGAILRRFSIAYFAHASFIYSSDTNSEPITCEDLISFFSRKYNPTFGLAGKSLAKLSLAAGYLPPFTCSKPIHGKLEWGLG